MNRDELAALLDAAGPEWWNVTDARHMASNLAEVEERGALDEEQIAHEMWTMGARLKHPKCRNNPKRGNDADYANQCNICQRHLTALARVILTALAALTEATR